MKYRVDSASFDASWEAVGLGLIQTCVMLFLYGIYVHFFISAIRNLSRREMSGKLPLLVATWTMFLFGTSQTLLELAETAISYVFLRQLVKDGTSVNVDGPTVVAESISAGLTEALDAVNNTQMRVFAINNLLTDSFLLYRCYLIWNRHYIVTILPVLLMISGFVLSQTPSVPLNATILELELVYNTATAISILLSGLTAGRIWWKQREAAHLVPSTDMLRKRYTNATMLIIESGVLYCICSICLAISAPFSFRSGPGAGVYYITLSISFLAINMIPTLALMRGTRESDALPPPSSVAPLRRIFNFRAREDPEVEKSEVVYITEDV
ncbi:hypothetical protein FB45DRAFT_915073 [Roridomyces roridus]|uniref:Uncharacterized protein n=1 Tax=Roridomyces roridus TaxID=1738132 RepID=A0AAD7BTF8_9AGAR|nr:hypothetical protein FB45DRAFT_915073 [Roridomyces roridus]